MEWYYYTQDADNWFTVYRAVEDSNILRPLGARFLREARVMTYVEHLNAKNIDAQVLSIVDNQK